MSRQRWLMAIMAVAIMAAASVWAFGSWRASPIPAAAADLAAYPEVDLGPLAGADAHIGVTRSEYLPILVTKGGRGDTSLTVLDAHLGTLTDAGPTSRSRAIRAWGATHDLGPPLRFNSRCST